MSIFLLDEFEKTIEHDALYIEKLLSDKIKEKRGEEHLRSMGFAVEDSGGLELALLEAMHSELSSMSTAEKVIAYKQAIALNSKYQPKTL